MRLQQIKECECEKWDLSFPSVWICTNSHCTILTPISVLKTLRQPRVPPTPPAPPPPLIGWPTEVAMEICVVGQACEMKGADFEWPNPLWYNFICTKTQISDHAILVCTVIQPNQQISLLGFFFFVVFFCPFLVARQCHLIFTERVVLALTRCPRHHYQEKKKKKRYLKYIYIYTYISLFRILM